MFMLSVLGSIHVFIPNPLPFKLAICNDLVCLIIELFLKNQQVPFQIVSPLSFVHPKIVIGNNLILYPFQENTFVVIEFPLPSALFPSYSVGIHLASTFKIFPAVTSSSVGMIKSYTQSTLGIFIPFCFTGPCKLGSTLTHFNIWIAFINDASDKAGCMIFAPTFIQQFAYSSVPSLYG